MKNVLGIALVLVPFLGLGCSKDSDPPAGSGGSGGTRSGGSGGARAGGDGGSSTAGSGGNPVTSGGTGGGVSGGAGGGGAAGGAGGTGGRAGSGGSGGGAADGPRGSGGAPGDGPAPVQGNPFVYVSTGNFSGNHLNIYQLNMMTGALEAKGMVPTGSGPTYADFSPDGKYVYVLNESASQVEAFSANRETGALTRINGVASGGAGPAHLSVHKSGKWVFAAHYTNGNLSVLPVNAQGGVGAAVYTDKPVPGQAHFVINNPSGKYVFLCAASANDRVVQYTINEATGQLTPNTPAFISGQGRSPRHMAFHPNGLWAYVIGEGGGNVLFLKLDPATGKLATPGVVVQGGMDGTHVLVHPNGKFLYTTFRGSSRVQVYSIAADGNLTSVQMVTEGIARPWDFTIDPSGSFVLVANDGNGTVKVFRINQESGMLTAAGNGAAVGNPHFVGVLK